MKTPLSISSKYQNFVFLLGNITAFLFFSLLLPTKSGHSIAIVLALITSALAIPFWKKEKLEPEILSACFFILFLKFLHHKVLQHVLQYKHPLLCDP